MQAGASGYVLKDMPLPTLVEAIRAVHAGRQFFLPSIAERLAERMHQAVPTERGLAVLKAIAGGMSNKRIGSALGIAAWRSTLSYRSA